MVCEETDAVVKSGRMSGLPDTSRRGGGEDRELLVERRARDAEQLGGEDLLALGRRQRGTDCAALRVRHDVGELERGPISPVAHAAADAGQHEAEFFGGEAWVVGVER